MKVDVDVRTLELQLNNGLITTPAEIRLNWEGVDLVVYTPASGDDDMAAHQVSLRLSGSRVDLIIRSPLGTKPEVRTLHDFAASINAGEPPLIVTPNRDTVVETVELSRVQYDLAVDIGAGSFSAGVRQALRKYP